MNEIIAEEIILNDTSIPEGVIKQLVSHSYEKHGEPQHPLGPTLTKPNNAWNYRSQRRRLVHLTRHPPSSGNQIGTRDISFLYDNSRDAPISLETPPSGISRNGSSEKKQSINNESLLPIEFQVIRSEAVAGLDTKPAKHTTHLCDVKDNLRIFPSLHPNRRFEAIQLIRTMDQMIAQLGIHDENMEINGPSQVHNLVELVKKEQNIYDTIFYELIRQVTIECKERGQLLGKIRQHYSDLLARVPRQINSLHSEVIAQRALDRRLTHELLHFKSSISSLTEELARVKKHDAEISREAETSHGELREALIEASKNSHVLQEYHQLYELQRLRLEKNVQSLTFERDIWNSTAYSLAIKLIEENELTVARRLYVSERSWSKMANHFTVLLAERDSADLADLQVHVETWRDMAIQLDRKLLQDNEVSRKYIYEIECELRRWSKIFHDTLIYTDFAKSRRMTDPDQTLLDSLVEDIGGLMKEIEKALSRYQSDDLLIAQDILSKMTDRVENWTDKAIELYSRHRSMEGERFLQHEVMSTLNDTVQKLISQLNLQVTGENGVTRRLSLTLNVLDGWRTKIRDNVDMTEMEWLRLVDQLDEWAQMCVDLNRYVNSVKGIDDESEDISLKETIDRVTKWLHSTLDGIEGEDGKISGMVEATKNDLLKWMSSSLLLLAPDKTNNKVLKEIAIPCPVTARDLICEQSFLSQHCNDLTDYIIKCVHVIVTEQIAMQAENGDKALLDQKKTFQKESREWEQAAQFLCEALQVILSNELEEVARKLAEKEKLEREKNAAKKKSENSDDENSSEEDEDEERGEHDDEFDENEEPKKSLDENIDLTKEIVVLDDKMETVSSSRAASSTELAENLFIIGKNENITSRPVSRPSEGFLAAPLTGGSIQALERLNTVEQLQNELLETEQRAQNAEMKIESLEEQVRELQLKLTRGGLQSIVEQNDVEQNEAEFGSQSTQSLTAGNRPPSTERSSTSALGGKKSSSRKKKRGTSKK